MTAPEAFKRSDILVLFSLLMGTACASSTPASGSTAADADTGLSAVVDVSSMGAAMGGAAVFHPQKGLVVELSSDTVVDGGMVIATVRFSLPGTYDPATFTSKFGDYEFAFFPLDEDILGFQSIVGVPHNTKPGEYKIAMHVGDADFEIPINVVDGKYRSEQLKVSPKHVNPNPKDMKRIKKESAETGAIYRTITRHKYWKGPFVMPVDSVFTSPYGSKRVFNGEMKGAHLGVDLRAKVGAKIFAPAPGKVVLAKNLFFSGGTVILDHGYGMYTLYAHMSKIKVKKGQVVKVKHLLGLAGQTGRVNGPHLHWGLNLGRVKVNPQFLIKVLK